METKIMGIITFTQNVTIKSGKNSPNEVFQKDFEINPADTATISDWNEDMFHRFLIPIGTTDLQLRIGTLDLVKVLVIKPESDLTAKIVSADGTSQNLVFNANRLSILHMNFSYLVVSNPSALPIKGWFYMAGD